MRLCRICIRELCKRAVIEKALEEFIENRNQKNLRDIRGKISFQDNYREEYKNYRQSKYAPVDEVDEAGESI